MIYTPWMDPEILWMAAIQKLSAPWLDVVMVYLSRSGEETVYIALIPFIYWCLHRELGLRLLAAIALSNFSNGLLKWALHSPRPYWYSDLIRPIAHENSFCPPSGHAQNAMTFWPLIGGGLAQAMRKPWPWIVFFGLAALVSFSRIYLGVHFPHSVLLGWFFGLILFFLFWKGSAAFERWYYPKPLWFHGLFAAGVAAIMLIVMELVHGAVAGFVLPGEWIENASRGPGFDGLSPFERKNYFGFAGVLAGVLFAAPLARRSAHFSVEGAWLVRLLRYALGAASVVVILYGPSILLRDLPEGAAYALRFVRYFLTVLWAVWLWPLLFLRLGLARREA